MPCNEAFSERRGFGETQKSGFKIKAARIEDKKIGAAPTELRRFCAVNYFLPKSFAKGPTTFLRSVMASFNSSIFILSIF